MKKAPDAFRTISEVADWLDVQAHVLRFWESKFTQVKPVKRAGGRRYYRPADMRLIGGIKTLLHDEGMTIKGVQKILREKGVEHVSSLSRSIDEVGSQDAELITLPTRPSKEASTQGGQDAAATETTSEPEDSAATPSASSEPDQSDVEDEIPEITLEVVDELIEETPNVVTFQSRKTRRSAADQPTSDSAAENQGSDPEPSEHDKAVDAEGPTAETTPESVEPDQPETPETEEPVAASQEDSEVETTTAAAEDVVQDTAAETAPEKPKRARKKPKADKATAEAAPEPSPEPEEPAEPSLFDLLPDEPKLPSFLHRSARAEPEPEPEVEEDPIVEAGPPKPRIVDAPDPPADDEIDAKMGPLGQLAGLESLPAASIDNLSSLVAEIRARANQANGTA